MGARAQRSAGLAERDRGSFWQDCWGDLQRVPMHVAGDAKAARPLATGTAGLCK